MEASPRAWPTLGVLLVRDGLVSAETLAEILDEQRDGRVPQITGPKLGEILVDRGLVSSSQIARLVAEQYELPYLDLELDDIDVRVARLLSEDDARRFSALPVGRHADGSFLLAVADPSAVIFSEPLRELLDGVPRFVVVGPDALAAALAYVRHHASSAEAESASESVAVELVAVPDDATAHETSRAAAQLWPPLGALLVREGLVSDEELEAALSEQRMLSTSRRLGEVLVERGSVTPADVARNVAKQYELDYIELDASGVELSIARLLPETVARTLGAVPIAQHENGSFDVAITDPTRVLYSDDVQAELAAPVRFLVASPAEIGDLVDRAHRPPDDHSSTPETTWTETLTLHDENAAPRLAASEPEPNATADEPMWAEEHTASAAAPEELSWVEAPPQVAEPVRFDAPAPSEHHTPVAAAIARALTDGATAIHLSHDDHAVRVRARVDTSLLTVGAFELDDITGLVSELMADPTMELSLVPTRSGMRLTVRPAVPAGPAPGSLRDLAMTAAAEETMLGALERPGLVVVTGTPGSGVTTTLHALLSDLDVDACVAVAVESDSPATVAGIDQIDVGDGGLTAGASLRALVDSDVDVLVVDAPLDGSALALAARAARGGSSVLVNLGEPDVVSALVALGRLGSDAESILSAVTCVVAQHLVSTICPDCRESYYATTHELALLERPSDEGQRLLVRGRGCARCSGRGLGGRRAVFEAVVVTDTMRQVARDTAPTWELANTVARTAVVTLREQAIRMCLEGETTSSEVERTPAPA